MKYTPKPYQKIAIDHILEHPRAALFAEMGMGKTSAVLYLLDMLTLVEDGPALVLAPLRVARDVWPEEVQKWERFRDLRIISMIGTPKQRKRAFETPADIYTINYENIPWLLHTCVTQKRFPFTKIVADESTRLKGFRTRQGGMRARALSKIAWRSNVKRFIALTGTPNPNGLADLWGQMWFLDKGERLGRSYTAFRSRWFYQTNPMFPVFEPKDHAQEEIQSRIGDLCLSLRAADWFDLDNVIDVDVPVTLPPKAQKQYNDFQRALFLDLQEHGAEVEATTAATKTIKCLQIANGAVYKDETGKEYAEMHAAKLDALESVVEETNGDPLLVVYHFRHDLQRILKRFPKARRLDEKDALKDWNAGRVPMLCVHPQSAGHGLNMADGGHRVVFFAHWWDLEQYDQVIARIGPVRQAQAGHPRPVFCYHIRAQKTLDGTVIERRKSKSTVQDALMRAMSKEVDE